MKEGYQAVKLFPDRVMLPERQEYQPVLTAVSREGKRLYVECEREKADEAPPREAVAVGGPGRRRGSVAHDDDGRHAGDVDQRD